MKRLRPLWPIGLFVVLAAVTELTSSRLLLAVAPVGLVPLPFVLARHSGRPSDPLEPIWLFGALLFFSYAVVGGLQLWSVERFMSLPGFLRLDGPHYAPTVWLGGLGFAGLCVGYELGAGRIRPRRASTVSRMSGVCLITGVILVAYGALALESSLLLVDASSFPIRTILTGGLRDAMFLALPGRGYLSVGYSALTLGGPCLCLALALRARDAPHLRRWVIPAMVAVVAVSAFVFVSLLGSRQLMMATVVELLVVYHYAYQRIRTRTFAALALALGVLGVTFISLRNRGSLTFDPVDAAGLASRTFDGFNFLLASVSRPIHHLWGQTLGEDLVYTYLPRSLFPGKPTVFGIITAQDTIIPGLSSSVRSGTFPPGILAEGYVNFGVLGVLILPMLLGAAGRALHRRAALEAPFFVLMLGWLLGNAVGAVRGLGSVLPAVATVTVMLSPLLVPRLRGLRCRLPIAAVGTATLVAIAALAVVVNPVVTPQSIAASGGHGAVGRAVPPAVTGNRQGAPSVLVIWASWCQECREQLRQAAAAGHGSRLPLLSVAYQDDPRVSRQVLESAGGRWTATLDSGSILAQLGADQLPTTYVINRDRMIACALPGPSDAALIKAALGRLRGTVGQLGPC